ncbi:MAG: hypothetical protein ABIQ73_06520 [Acidimicrobiales bacterium]
MTDDREARVAALKARRRPNAGATTEPVAPTAATTEPVAPTAVKMRRRHAATGGRILFAGLSVSAALVLTTAMARNDQQAVATSAPDIPTTQAAPIVVRIVIGASPAVDAPAAPTASEETSTPSVTTAPAVATAPSAVAAATPAPVPTRAAATSSRGS